MIHLSATNPQLFNQREGQKWTDEYCCMWIPKNL